MVFKLRSSHRQAFPWQGFKLPSHHSRGLDDYTEAIEDLQKIDFPRRSKKILLRR